MIAIIDAKSVPTPALVYVRTNGRVWPQIWHEPKTDLDGYWRGRIVAVKPLDDIGSKMIVVSCGRLSDLLGLFPMPALKEDD